jgi:hypothetical protein
LSLHQRERALSDGCAVVCGRSLSGKLAARSEQIGSE